MQVRSILAIAAAATTLIAGGGAVLSGQQTRPDQPPAFRTGIEVVSVDVGVVDKQGQPLHGLVPTDFIVTVGGQPRRVVTAEFVDRTAERPTTVGAPDIAAVSTNEGGGVGRLFVFIVDQNTLDLGNARRVASAAAPFFDRLTFADRSALMLMPLGPNVPFTWAHTRVQQQLSRVSGMGRQASGWEFGSLSEARDISTRNPIALRSIEERECRGSSISAGGLGSSPAGPPSGGATPPAGPASPTGGGTPPGGETGGTGTAPPTAGPPAGATSGPTRSPGGLGGFGLNACSRDIQMQADSAWRSAQMNSLASLGALRQFLEVLGRVRGDKTVILISGGWPLEEREENSLVSMVAADAAAARASIFSIFVPSSPFSAERRMMTSTPMADNYLHLGPLETLSAMTGGASFRAEVGAERIFEQLGREMAGYYRIGVEKDPADADGKNRRMKVQVSRSGVNVRAREVFDVRSYEDRDWAARLASAIDGPVPATGVGLRVTSYLSADPDTGAHRRLLLSGEISRAQRGEATVRVLVSDLQGTKVTSGEVPLMHTGEDTMPFSTNIAVPPGNYIVRVGVIDSAGHVGSVDHRVDVRDVPVGPLSATGPLLVRVPAGGADARLALDSARQNERLALEVDLEGDTARLDGTDVQFEIAATTDGPALIHTPAVLSRSARDGFMLAQGAVDLRVLPPGSYIARAKIKAGAEPLGEVRRAFTVLDSPRLVVEAGNASGVDAGRTATSRHAARLPAVAVAPFALEQVLSAPVLHAFLDRVAARPDASSPAVRELLDRARSTGLEGLAVTDAQAGAPVGAFLKGLALLAENKLEPAAASFRSAMRTSADFYPAMVYLGACYAAGGNDKEAAGAWRTALIREGDTVAVHAMLADAFLRQGRGDLAVADLTDARARWPADEGLNRRFVVAALQAGRHTDGLQALDDLVAKKADDEPSLALALLVLYEAFESREPIESIDRDRARMVRYADSYRARGGPSLALIDTWVDVATRKN